MQDDGVLQNLIWTPAINIAQNPEILENQKPNTELEWIEHNAHVGDEKVGWDNPTSPWKCHRQDGRLKKGEEAGVRGARDFVSMEMALWDRALVA